MGDRLRWGVLGSAGIARAAVMPAIEASNNGVLAAVSSRDPQAAQHAAGSSAGLRFVSYDDLLNDPHIDAIYVPLPNSMHADWTVRAAEAGKAVLCEKPLATDMATAQQVAMRCRELRVPLMEGFMYRFHPQHARVKALIEEGAIGEVVEVRAHLCVDIMSPADPENVRFKPELGGGALLDMGCYTASICRMIMGEEPVRATGCWQVDPRFGVDVSAQGILEFSAGRTGLVSCSFRGNSQGSYTVVGRKGAIEVPRGIIPGLGTRAPEALVILCDGDGRRREEVIPAVDQYRLMVEAFADAVLNSQKVPLSPDDSVANMRVLDAMARSARSGASEAL